MSIAASRTADGRSVSDRMRRNTVAILSNDRKKQEARQSAVFASERGFQVLFHANHSNDDAVLMDSLLGDFHSLGSDDEDDDDNKAYSSAAMFRIIQNDGDNDDKNNHSNSERAALRGMKLGSRELSETLPLRQGNSSGRILRDDPSVSSQLDLSTMAGTFEHRDNKPRKKKKIFFRIPLFAARRNKARKDGGGLDGKSASKGEESPGEAPAIPSCHAWMCGVCGMAFSRLEACDKHEQQHIADVVAGMEWNKTDSKDRNKKEDGQAPLSLSEDRAESNLLRKPAYQKKQALHFDELPDTLRGSESQTNGSAARSPTSNHAVGTSSPLVDTVRFSFPNNDEVKIEDDDDGYPGLEADLPAGTLLPKPRALTYSNSEAIFTAAGDGTTPVTSENNYQRGDFALLLPNDMKDQVMLADEALYDVVSRAVPMILTRSEVQAERELALLARDKAYYDELSRRAAARNVDPFYRFRPEGEDLLAKVQNKFLDAYQLMKESDGKKGLCDQYNRKHKSGEEESPSIVHTDSTLYVNVMVKNSVHVVRHELERLAKQRWEVAAEDGKALTRFERFRVYTQINVVKLAGIALASDFTPRRIAVQLSNDLYRLLTPRLKRRGVTIETEIEYRVGPYFVLAVNIKTIDWWKLIKATNRDVALRQVRWESEQKKDVDLELGKSSVLRRQLVYMKGILDMSIFDVIERTMAFLYHFHWFVYLPVCWVAYHTVLGSAIRQFILASVADEIFFYVEEKGMEMDIKVCRTESQAAFMLSALREIRADGQELKKKREQSESREKGHVLGPLMGPAIAADKGPAPPPPEGFEVPTNLEFIGLELDLPVGFQRLRWALLSKRSEFLIEVIYKTEARYENIVVGGWNKYPDHIGEHKLPDGVNPKDFVGAEKEGEYLMPKSAFVSANMSYETHHILAYNDYCFCIKKRSKNPDAPFGKTFVAWTQYLVVNTGGDTCKLTCSVEAEFPNGEPMVSRQIRSGMRAGTGELFVLIGEAVAKYADEFP